MPKINILPKEVYNLIAAGEVVERPMSIVKEMIENSIDANAKHIVLEIQHGGTTYIRITDDGCGISKEDVKKVFISHATSKIATSDDLNTISTLGFRGEAMASIGAVAKVQLLTKSEDEEIGTSYTIEGGQELDFSEAGCPNGTTIVVRDIFFNVPARMKFLKKDVTEGNAVEGIVKRIAMSHPEISFRFIREGKQSFITPGNGNLKSTIYSVLGGEISDSLVEVNYEYNGMKVTGFTSKPYKSRKSRAMQFFFINKRFVKSGVASAALEQAYKNVIMVGHFPSCVLNIEIDTKLVDVNVHPSKTEVRFTNEKPIFDLIYYGIKTAILNKDTVKEATIKSNESLFNNLNNGRINKDYIKETQNVTPKKDFYKKEEVSQMKISSAPKDDFWSVASSNDFNKQYKNENKQKNVKIDLFKKDEKDESFASKEEFLNQFKKEENTSKDDKKVEVKEEKIIKNDSPLISNFKENKRDINKLNIEFENENDEEENENIDTTNVEIVEEKNDVPPFFVIGEAFRTYIIVQMGNDLYYIDKHAAHERMNFEELKRNAEKGINSQMLLSPVAVKLSSDEYIAITENLNLLYKCGFLVEDFGNSSVIVRETPAILDGVDVKDLIAEIAEKLILHKTDIMPDKMDWIFHSASCRGAVKGGDYTTPEERELFVKRLLSMPNIRYCPHGRPVMIKISKYEIEKQFGRIQ